MKKLIAISVMLALVTGAVFAQVSFGGHFGIRANTLASTTAEDSDLMAGINMRAARMNVDFANDTGTAGGRVRLYAAGFGGWWGDLPFAFAWWRPVPNVRIQIGHNPDGDLGAAQLTGWGLIAEAQDYVAIDQDSGDGVGVNWQRGRRDGFYGGYTELGAIVTFNELIEGLTLHLVLPFGNGRAQGDKEAFKDVYSKFHLNAVYGVGDLGTFRFAFQGFGGLHPDVDASIGDVFASFFFTYIDNNAFDLGFRYRLPYKNGDVAENGDDITVYPGMHLGLGYRLSAGSMMLRARIGTFFGGTTAQGAFLPTQIGLVIHPTYRATSAVFHLNTGVGVSLPPSDRHPQEFEMDGYINPYMTRSVSNCTFYAGFKFGSGDLHKFAGKYSDKPEFKWAIPIGFGCHF